MRLQGLVILFATLLAVDAVRLRIVPDSKAKIQRFVAANSQFSPPIQVEAINDEGIRITTGYDSQLNISIVLSNSSGCISIDAGFQMQAGLGTFLGSLCSPIKAVSINFTAVTVNATRITSDATPLFHVTGEIHIAHFQEKKAPLTEGLNALILGAVADINEGVTRNLTDQNPVLPGRRIYIRNYVHGGNQAGAVKAYRKLQRNAKFDAPSKPLAILGFGNNLVSDLLLPMAMIEDYSVLSYANDSLSKFSKKDKYPFFNRLVYSDRTAYHGLIVYLLERKWKDIVLLKSSNSRTMKEFSVLCKSYGINIRYEVEFPSVSDYNTKPAGEFGYHFAKIKSVGTKIIVTVAKKPASFYIFCEALDQNVTLMHGYQWIGLDTEEDFPHANEPNRCHKKENMCNFAFKGMTFITSHYLINGYSSPQWTSHWKRYFEIDEDDARNEAADFWKTGSQYALAYDAVHVYALAFKKLIDARRTITAQLLSTAVRSIQLSSGMLSNISLTADGDPSQFVGRLSLVWPNQEIWNHFHSGKAEAGWIEPWDWSLSRLFSNPMTGYFIVESPDANTSIEIRSDGGSYMMYTVDWMKDERLKLGYIEWNKHRRNLRKYKSVTGLFSLDEQKQVEESWTFVQRYSRKSVGYNLIQREEYVPLAFYCELGCGGNNSDPEDINRYENGHCSAMGTCTCSVDAKGKALWRGVTCEIPVCNDGCAFGNCSRPNFCECKTGWKGLNCHTPICNRTICDKKGGYCYWPEQCRCYENYYGIGCSKKCSCKRGKCRNVRNSSNVQCLISFECATFDLKSLDMDCGNGPSGDGTCSECHTGYFGINCSITFYAVVFPVIIGMGLLVGFFLSSVNCYMKRITFKTDLHSTDWIVTWSDVKRSEKKAEKSMFLTKPMHVQMRAAKKQGLESANTGTWQGVDVHYQKFKKPSMEATDSLLFDVKVIREMRHDNLVRFIGACLESPHVAVLTELASKGSLDDLLAHEDILLPWTFKYSLLKDICRGLEYIHQSDIGSHGRLKSSNCLVDSRWTLKLSGFGLKRFRDGTNNVEKFQPGKAVQMEENETSEANFFDLFWTAPEILKTGVYHLDHVGNGTPDGDIYSFAIIFSEVVMRECPFKNLKLSNQEIVDLIAGRTTPYMNRIWNKYLASKNMEAGGPVRPCILQSAWPEEPDQNKPLKMLIDRCWTHASSIRPLPRDVLKNLERIDPNCMEAMEKLVSMLEKYSSNLEDIVADRAKALIREKQKTDNLVSQLLPRPIVEDLKLGKNVEAEHFECITICFSDFVNFQTIANGSTPYQLIKMLNKVYSSFDSVVAKFDAHKIDTIGNMYMVVSGLPVLNENQHADEIAELSLGLVDEVKAIKLKNYSDKQLQIRTGIHTGGVAAGIVGLKIPRYCVFGETVNIASMMESTCDSMRIQVSDETVKLLKKSGNYQLELRGDIKIKARTYMKTWWLNGRHCATIGEEAEEKSDY